MMQLSQISTAVNGRLIGADVALSGVITDTRGNCQNGLFVALKGERFDAHDFVLDAQNAGAGAALVERDVECSVSKVVVNDTSQALKDLAAWWRAQFVIPVIGVTGSVGKTTVKEMLGCIYAQLGKGVVTKGNLNNEIGLPLTILRLSSDDQYAIVEMGMNHSGEISRLTNIAKPTIALINNAGAAHLEGLGTIEAVARAKGEIFEGLSDDGVAIINADDRYVALWRELIGSKQILTFGLSSEADVSADYVLDQQGLTMNVRAGEDQFNLRIAALGKHNVVNALAAIAVAVAANVPTELIVSGLEKYRPIGGRLNIQSFSGVTVIDDSYNANPASMLAAIDVLSQFQNSVLILGDMAELGDASESEHVQLGKLAALNKIDHLYVYGDFAQQVADGFGSNANSFATQEELLTCLTKDVNLYVQQANTAILIKGSRSARMEHVVEHVSQLVQMSSTDDHFKGAQ